MRTSTENDQQPAADDADGFCLADTLADLTDAELEQMAEEHAQGDVSSNALEGIPLDKARMKAGLLASYQKMRAERQTDRQQPIGR